MRTLILDEELFNEKATWIDFQKRHILEPVGDNSGYLGWSRTQWNTFLRTRIDNYGSKAVNTFIISTPDAIRNNLADATQQVHKTYYYCLIIFTCSYKSTNYLL